MFSKTTTPGTTRRHLAETHARMMFTYYYLRALLETTGAVAAEEQEATRYLAIESRRFGFRLEAQAVGLHVGAGDGDATEVLGHQATDAVDVLLVDPEAEQLVEVIDREA